jgi:hypothetical protein
MGRAKKPVWVFVVGLILACLLFVEFFPLIVFSILCKGLIFMSDLEYYVTGRRGG